MESVPAGVLSCCEMIKNQALTNEELEELLREAFDHLTEGRHRMALSAAQKVFDRKQTDFRAAICLAWAFLENGEPNNAMEYADLAVKLGNSIPQTRLYRGFILQRLGIFEGAIRDLDIFINSKSEPRAWAHHLKAKALAGLEKYADAFEQFDFAMKEDKGKSKIFPRLREWYKNASGNQGTFLTKLVTTKERLLIDEAEEAFKLKEFWYAKWAINKILSDDTKKEYHQRAELLDIETMSAMFQLKPALAKAEKLKESFGEDARFAQIYNKLVNSEKIKSALIEKKGFELKPESNLKPLSSLVNLEQKTSDKKPIIMLKKRTDFVRYDTPLLNAIFARTFDYMLESTTGNRVYFIQFSESYIQYIGLEAIVTNPYYDIKDTVLKGEVIWYLNESEVGRHDFDINLDRSWRNVVFIETWGTDVPGFWKRGQGRVEVFVQNEKICEKWFLIGVNEIVSNEEFDLAAVEKEITKKVVAPAQTAVGETPASAEDGSLEAQLAQLDKLTGLASVKQSMRDFIDYLEFIKERKKLGLKTQDGISVNSVFLGNPGTGKTTVARLLGNIFKSMGILEKGHVVEVDRAALVGQYVGETAQKTDKVLEDAIGGLLFIDEAYTLVKKGGGGQDFGQEAIDTLLKRMEDKAGQFAVIVAGYPDEMNDFLTANPGMKSRFTHSFMFEDYTPTEMIEIFTGMSKKEEYSVDAEGVEFLMKEFTVMYRKRDKTFGNARVVRNFFNDAKMQLSKRYLKLPESMRDKRALTTIKLEDIREVFKSDKQKSFAAGIDEEALNRSLAKLNSLTGLGLVKKEVNELVKLTKFYLEQGENIQNRFTDHILFLGNPGTGKTTVARLVSQIYSALGLLPKGHLVEADRQSLVASFVGKTAEKTTEIVNQAIGGTLFVDEAYALVKQGDSSDFGKEAIDTLLKRMEDDRGKFIVIAAGYTDDMTRFLESNPGLQSRFTKVFTFEDYQPEELLLITQVSLKEKELNLSDEARERLKVYYNEIYRTRDKNFGNARLVRNLVEAAARNQLLRLIDIPKENRTPEIVGTITLSDILDLITKKVEKKEAQVEGNKQLLDAYFAELEQLTGLDSVKKSVEKLVSSLKVAKLREERGLKVIRKNLHAVFLGNPGTGKTTVARLMSKIYKEMGLLEKGHLVEVDRSALVAGYTGQTATKTDEVIKKALGGTLFIDEAYTLARGGGDFGQEAIDTLLKRMEDFKEQMIVIVAGYTNEMRDFLDANPGMQSRFTNFFYFEDYIPREMLEIASGVSEKSGYKLDEGALQGLLEVFQNAYATRDKNFGNARTVRNLLFKAISNQEERILTLSNPSDQDLITITLDDVQNI